MEDLKRMSGDYVKTTYENGVMLITIDRQDKLNALNSEVLKQLQSAFDDARQDDNVRCVVITGAGEKAFVAGADIAEIRSLDSTGVADILNTGHTLMNSIEQLGKPVIAAVNGYALGGGCELALACHLRIAANSALLGLPEVQLGLMPGYGGSQRLSRLTGNGRALEMMLTGKPVSAEQARDYGIVNQVTEPGELMAVTLKLASRLAASAPCAMRSIMDAVQKGTDTSLQNGLDIEAALFAGLFDTEDMREGTAAFLEKRKPEFKGR
jgi:enoyl-CoA hydratase